MGKTIPHPIQVRDDPPTAVLNKKDSGNVFVAWGGELLTHILLLASAFCFYRFGELTLATLHTDQLVFSERWKVAVTGEGIGARIPFAIAGILGRVGIMALG